MDNNNVFPQKSSFVIVFKQLLFYHGLIFKSIEDEASESGMRIANTFKEAFSSDKFLGFANDSVFNSTLENDKASLDNYLASVNSGVSKQEAFNKTMFTASDSAKEYAKSVDIQSISADKFATFQRKAQVELSAGDKSLGNIKTILNEYNSSLDETSGGLTKCGLSQQDFINAVGKGNGAVGNFLSDLNGAKATMGGYVGAMLQAKAASLAMEAATMALNVAISTGVTLAITALIKGVQMLADALDNSFSKAVERAAESRKAFDEVKTGVDGLNDQIKDVDIQINDLEGKSTTNKQDIQDLQKQKELLEAQRDIQQQIADQEGKKAREDAVKALTQKREYDRQNYDYSGNGYDTSTLGSERVDIIDETAKKQEELNFLTDGYNKTLIQLSKTNIGDKNRKGLELDLRSYKSQIDSLQSDITENQKGIAEQVDTLSQFSGNEDLINRAKAVYEQTENGVEQLQTIQEIADGMDFDLTEALGDGAEEFTQNIDSYIAKTSELDNALGKLRDEGLNDSDIKQLVSDFPELEGQTDNLENAIVSLMSSMDSDAAKEFSSQMENIKTAGGVAEMQKLKDSILGAGSAAIDTSELFKDLKTAQEQYANIAKAITESNSAGGLTMDNLDLLDAMYSDIDGYDQSALFEKTATGIHINREELQRLNEEYEKGEADKYTEALGKLNQELAIAKEQRDKYAKYKDSENEADIAKKELYDSYAENVSNIEDQIASVQNLAAAWQGTTSAYNEYIQAQSTSNDRDSILGLANDRENMKKLIQEGWTDDDSLNAYLDTILGEDRIENASKAWKQLGKDIGDTGHSINDYLAAGDEDGFSADNVKMWYNDIEEVAGEGFTKIGEDGAKVLDLTGDNIEKLAEKFGSGVEFINLMAMALQDINGYEVDFGNITSGVDQLKSGAEQVSLSAEQVKNELSVLQEAGKLGEGINLDINVDTAKASELKAQLDQLAKVKIDAEVDPSGAAALEQFKSELQQEYYIKINAETDGKIEEAQQKIEAIKKIADDNDVDITAAVNLEGADGDKVKSLADDLKAMPPEVKTAVGIEVDGDVNSILSGIENKKITIPANIDYKQSEITTPEVPDAHGKVNYEIGNLPEEPKYENQNPKINYSVDAPPEPKYKNQTPKITYSLSAPPEPSYSNIDRNITYHIHTVGSAPSGGGPVDGTARPGGSAFAKGTAKGRAFKSGYWGTRSSGLAIGGELGEEILVRDGHFYTIGSDSAELFKYKKGDIIE